jgi:hypothetical protein
VSLTDQRMTITFATTEHNNMKNKKYITFDAELVLGNPKLSCERYGVCKIIQADDITTYVRGYQRVAATCRYTNDTQVLRIDFWTDSLSAATYKQYFGNGYFVIEDACTPVLNLDKTILIPNTLTLAKGHYPIIVQQIDALRIEIALENVLALAY